MRLEMRHERKRRGRYEKSERKCLAVVGASSDLVDSQKKTETA
jgi:hypothetical protein